MGIRGKDKNKRKAKRRRAKSAADIKSIHEHLQWYKDEGGFHPHGMGEPTCESPGTLMKLEVLRRRVENGEPLWNPDDLEPDAG